MGLSGELCASPHPCGMTLDFGRAGWEGRRAHQAAGWKMFDALGVRVYVYEYVCMYVCMYVYMNSIYIYMYIIFIRTGTHGILCHTVPVDRLTFLGPGNSATRQMNEVSGLFRVQGFALRMASL